jgi:hypothetical protein
VARQTTPIEAAFQKRVLKFLKDLPNTYYFKKEAASIRGIPDIIACIGGVFVALELKRSSKCRATELQQYNIMMIGAANGFACVCYPENWDDVKRVLTKYSLELYEG